MKIYYVLEVYNKYYKAYMVHWEGKTLERARIMANKSYNNREHHGKRRIIKVIEEIVK